MGEGILIGKKSQSLSYLFAEEISSVFENKKFDDMFSTKGTSVVFKNTWGRIY